MNELIFEVCPICGNLVERIEAHAHDLSCCGQPLHPLMPNSTEAAVEKHLPIITLTETELVVHVSDVEHPMIATHWIPWVIVQTPTAIYRQHFEAGDVPKLTLPRPVKGTPVRVYAYCNLHGLWMTEMTC